MAWLTPSLLARLQGPEGCAWLAAAAEVREDPFVVARLQQQFPGAEPAELAAAVEQVRLRIRARGRFSSAETMWFAESLLEQASAEDVARYHAGRFAAWAATCCREPRIGDLCCGLGSDSLELARLSTGSTPICSVDRAPLSVALTQANARALGLADRIEARCADVSTCALELDAAWMDPGRREGARRTRKPEELSPPLSCLLDWRRRLSAAGIKLSPASNLEELNQYLRGEPVEWEWISARGSCRELVLWFGGTAARPGQRSATLAEAGLSLTGVPRPYPGLSAVGRYLLEPDPAVIRAGLVGNLAEELGATALDPLLAYLTRETPASTPWGTWFRVERVEPFRQKELVRQLRAARVGNVEFKCRGSAVDPDLLRQQLRAVLKQGEPGRCPVVFLTRLGRQPTMILGERVDLRGQE